MLYLFLGKVRRFLWVSHDVSKYLLASSKSTSVILLTRRRNLSLVSASISTTLLVLTSDSGPIFGLEGQAGFQVSGLIVAGIIAHYSYRMFRFIGNVGKEDYDDDDVQE